MRAVPYPYSPSVELIGGLTERPFHLAIATLFWCSLGWYLVGRWSCIPKGDQFDHGRKDDAYSKLESGGRSSRLWQKGSRFFSIGRGSVGSVALHIILRMIMTRWIIGYVECSWNGIEVRKSLALLTWHLSINGR